MSWLAETKTEITSSRQLELADETLKSLLKHNFTLSEITPLEKTAKLHILACLKLEALKVLYN